MHQLSSNAPAAIAAAAAVADYDYTQVTAPAYGAGLIHRGFRNTSDEIWGDDSAGLQAVLQKFIVNATNGAITSVLFGGHSM
jgi:multidrug efflux pump subunit AcrA (membrane-fusion protein)